MVDNFGSALYEVILLIVVMGVNGAAPAVRAQSAVASLSGRVVDQSEAAIPGAAVKILNSQTGFQRETRANADGGYTFPLLPPATYVVTASADGFAPAEVRNITLNVNDERSLRLQLKPGNINETVQVTSEAPLIDESPAVATTVDRQFVEKLPLNGRTFQSLIALTPGVVMGNFGTTVLDSFGFSVNGQRPTANYFTVDGVSANAGSTPNPLLAQTGGGGVPAVSVTGGTQALVPLDAMQEFTIQTSTYSAKFGRQPGAQVSIATRSGSNIFHGAVFEYLRNEKLDANDWFTNRSGLPRAPLRQNDFGGVLGGPIFKNKTFFFGSYEGLRLRLPQTRVFTVASQSFREAAHPQVRPILDASPRPNGRDLNANAGEFVATSSNPQTVDAYSLRLDHHFGAKLTLFGRYHDAPSEGRERRFNPALFGQSDLRTQTLTVGSSWLITDRMTNDLRLNYTRSMGRGQWRMDDFAGATPPDKTRFLPPFADPDRSLVSATINEISTGNSMIVGRLADNLNRQINVVDNVSIVSGAHRLEMGIDYRYLYPHTEPLPYQVSITVLNAQTARAQYAVNANDIFTLVFHNFSAYGQDTWKVTPRLTLTYGLRWELVPPPHASEGPQPLTLDNLDNLSQVRFAAPGTKVWETTYGNFAPRVGAAYTLFPHRGWETVVRGGFGVFYDLGYASFSNFANSAPYSRRRIVGTTTMPVDPNLLQPPPLDISTPLSSLNTFARDIKLPYTLQWNVSIEQSLGPNQTFTASYVAAAGRRLLHVDRLALGRYPGTVPLYPGTITTMNLTRNGSTSDYHSLQLQYQRRMSHGFQALMNYTLAKSLDSASGDGAIGDFSGLIDPKLFRGPSNFDVRHNFSTALTYDIPMPVENGFAQAILGNWSADSIVRIQSAPPVDVTITQVNDLLGAFTGRPDLVLGQPLYIADPAAPMGRRINPAAFAPAFNRLGTGGRNVARGFGSWQADVSLRRQFNLTERVNLQFRAEMFNVFNHPNFGQPSGNYGSVASGQFISSASFGLSPQMLNRALGGLNALHQVGGPRSIQFALRLGF